MSHPFAFPWSRPEPGPCRGDEPRLYMPRKLGWRSLRSHRRPVQRLSALDAPAAHSGSQHRSSCSQGRWRLPSSHPPPPAQPNPPGPSLPLYLPSARIASSWTADALCRTSTGYCGQDTNIQLATGMVSGRGRPSPSGGRNEPRSWSRITTRLTRRGDGRALPSDCPLVDVSLSSDSASIR